MDHKTKESNPNYQNSQSRYVIVFGGESGAGKSSVFNNLHNSINNQDEKIAPFFTSQGKGTLHGTRRLNAINLSPFVTGIDSAGFQASDATLIQNFNEKEWEIERATDHLDYFDDAITDTKKLRDCLYKGGIDEAAKPQMVVLILSAENFLDGADKKIETRRKNMIGWISFWLQHYENGSFHFRVLVTKTDENLELTAKTVANRIHCDVVHVDMISNISDCPGRWTNFKNLLESWIKVIDSKPRREELLTINRATYKVGNQCFDMTQELQTRVQSDSLFIPSGTIRNFIKPKLGWWSWASYYEHLELNYTLNGKKAKKVINPRKEDIELN